MVKGPSFFCVMGFPPAFHRPPAGDPVFLGFSFFLLLPRWPPFSCSPFSTFSFPPGCFRKYTLCRSRSSRPLPCENSLFSSSLFSRYPFLCWPLLLFPLCFLHRLLCCPHELDVPPLSIPALGHRSLELADAQSIPPSNPWPEGAVVSGRVVIPPSPLRTFTLLSGLGCSSFREGSETPTPKLR